MEAVQNLEERKVKNLKVDPYARTLAVTQNALTLNEQEQIVGNLTFLTKLQQEATRRENIKRKNFRHFQKEEQEKRIMAGSPIIIPGAGLIDGLPAINNLAIGATVVSLAYAGTVIVSSKIDTYIKEKETKEYIDACHYIKKKANEQKKAIINSIR